MDVDWSDWTGTVKQKEHSLSAPLNPALKKGADVAADALSGNLPVMQDCKKQPTNEELFGHLVVSKEQLKKAEDDWVNTFKRHFNGIGLKIDHLNKNVVDKKWEQGKSFNSLLSKEEVEARNSYIGQ